MTIKKASLLALTALTVASTALAGNFGGKKFYINPGHGGHDSDDRPTPLPLGVEMFYESDGTLSRGKYLGSFISANGGSYKLSRTTNTTADDLPLSTIAAQSNSYGGYFMSLHTNGANASANYVVGFFRSSSSAKTTETISGAKAMTEQAVNWHDDTKLTNLTYSTARAMGDYSFYGYNLGVLRTNNRPGYLMESWFHDYRPEGLRMKSGKYNKFLAWQLCRAAMSKPGATDATLKGCIIGDIRNTAKSCGYSNYTSRGRDTYLAINGAKVVLLNSAGTQVASMTTDNCCNGVYAFFDLAPGTYTVKVSKSGYVTKSASVTVANNKSTLKNFNLSEGVDSGIDAPGSKDFGTVEIGSTKTISATITGTGLSSAISVASSSSLFTVDQTSLAKTGGTLKITFKPTAVGAKTGKITLTSGSQKATISLTATGKNPVLAMSGGYRYGNHPDYTSVKLEVPGDWLPNNNWGKLRNMDYAKGKLYIVNPTDNAIYVVNAQTFELITSLRMPTMITNGGTYQVMDVKVKGNQIFACNLTQTADQYTTIYKWDNDYAVPELILKTKSRGSVERMGDTFDIDGNLTSGRFLFIGKNPNTGNYKVVTYAITDGTVATTPVNYGCKSDDGKYLDLGSAPRVVTETSSRFWVMGSNLQPTLLGADGIATKSINTACLGDVVAGNDFVRFNFKGDSYALATSYPKKGSTITVSSKTVDVTEGATYGYAVLLDGNDGWASAKKVKYYPAAGLGPTRNSNYSTSVCVKVHKDDNGDAYAVESWVLASKQGIQYFKYCDSGKTLPGPTLLTPGAPDVSFDISDTDSDLGNVEIGKSISRKIKVTATNIYSDVKVSIGTGGTSQSQFKVTPATLTYNSAKGTASGTVTVTYAPTEEARHYINLRCDVNDATGTNQKFYVKIYGTGIANSSSNPDPTDPDPTDPDEPEPEPGQDGPVNDNITSLKTEWIYSTTQGNLDQAPWFKNVLTDSYTRDIAVNGTTLYVLNSKPWKTPEILIIDAETGKQTGTVNMEGITGGQCAASAITMLGDQLVLTNAARCSGVGQDATTDALKVYRWNDLSQAPEVWVNDATHGSAHIGEHINSYGDMQVGALYYSDGQKIYIYRVNAGTIAQSPEVLPLSKNDALTGINTLSNGVVHVANSGNGFWLNGKDAHPHLFDVNGEYVDELQQAHTGGSVGGTSVTSFQFGNRNYVASTSYLENATAVSPASLTGGVLSLTDVTGGESTQKLVAPATGLGQTRNTEFNTRVLHTIDPTGTKLNLYVMVPSQGVAKYSFDGSVPSGIQLAGDYAAPSCRVVNGHIVIEGNPDGAVLCTTTGQVIATSVPVITQLDLTAGVYVLSLQHGGKVQSFKIVL